MLLFLIAKIVNYGSAQEIGKDPRSSDLDSRSCGQRVRLGGENGHKEEGEEEKKSG